MAQTLTSKLKLAKHDTGDLNWGADANANMDALDQHVQQALLRPPRTLTATLGSGAVGANLLGNTNYFFKVTAINAVGETTEGQIPAVLEAQVTQPATPLPVILQWETVSGATGYKIYKATASGQEQFLAQVTGQATSTYTDTGNTATTLATVPASNTARTSVSQIVAGSNVTVSPPDGTGAVTVNATVPTPPAASDTVQGDTKLSVAPAVAGNPIAVGINDPSVTNARAPTGAASGDLSGTYPNPSVAKVNGVGVSGTPSAGQVLTATGPATAAWQAPAGGGASGYATVVTAAPTGVAATDTAAIQAAVNALPAAGGRVILREGNYVLNASIALPSGKPLEIVGQGEATLLTATANISVFTFSGGLSTTGCAFRDFRFDAGANASSFLFDIGFAANQVMADFEFSGIHCLNANRFINALPQATGSVIRRWKITRNHIEECGYLCFINDNGVGSIDDVSIEGNQFRRLTYNSQNVIVVDGTDISIKGNTIFDQGPSSASTDVIAWNRPISKAVIADNVINGGARGVGNFLATPSTGRALTDSAIVGNVINAASNSVYLPDSANANVLIAGNRCVTPINLLGGTAFTIVGNIGVVNDTSGGTNTIINTTSLSGDLAGTYPSPTVAKINGTSVPAAPSAGQVLTATSPTAAAWQTPAAAGGGYATAVVAAPTGVAATDTANINAALTSVAANGGTVILREGTYVVNATLSPAANVTIMGQGRGATVIKADAGLGANSLFNIASGSTHVTIQDLKLNFNFSVRGTIASVNDMTIVGAGFKMIRVWALGHTAGTGASAFSMINNTSATGNMVIDNCRFDIFGDNGSQGPTCGNGYIAANSLLVSGSMFRPFSGDIVLITANTTGSSNIGFISVIGNEFYPFVNNITDMIKLVTGIAANNRFSTSSATVTRAISTIGFAASQVTACGNCAMNGTSNGAISIGGTNTSAVGNVGFSSYTASVTAANS